jgi:hypothetical protein
MSLASFWRDQAKRSKRANCSLRFTAGSPKDPTRDLKEAKALLGELAE